MAGNLFDVPWAEITMVDHDAQYGFCRFIKLDTQDVATQELKDAAFSQIYEPLNYTKDGEPFLCRARIPRAVSLCNYTIHAQQPFTIHDIQADESFATWAASPARFYSGAPIFINGYVVATFCLIDSRPRPDFTKAHEIQLQQMAVLAAQHIENWSLRQEMERLETARRRAVSTSEKSTPPDDVAALIFTDIQGSTTLWESNPRAMQVALNLHDEIMRKCIAEHHGYEVLTEGDAFHIAFHDAVDATLFALEAQQNLQNAQWDDEILALPDAADDGRGFRGVRVRIAIHCGDVKSQDNKVSGRREYSGRTYHIAKSLEHMSHGGQVLATHDVWNAVSYLSESKLGSPQVIDLGTHVLWSSRSQRDGVIAKGVVELVPKELAFDYSLSREHQTEEKMEGPTDTSHSSKHGESLESLRVDFGRHFPPPISSRRLSAAFHDAPCANTRAAIAFIYTLQIEKRCDDPSVILAALTKLIGTLLGPGPGYQCKNFMLAFPCTTDAVEFGMLLQETLKDKLVEGEDLHGLIQVGIHEGPFSSLVPHKVTGRADYFGKVVNRAARVAGAAHPGTVVVAVVEGTSLPELGSSFDTTFLGTKTLKGVQEDMALYACCRK
jgi:class 3 adenylate cyclase